MGTWDSTKSIIEQRTSIPGDEGGVSFAWNDMDMLETGNYKQAAHANGKLGTMTRTEYMTEFSMWAIFASPLTVSSPILNCSKTDQINGDYTPGKCRPSITDLQKEILLNKEVIEINQDVTPAGRLLSTQVGSTRFTCSVTQKISHAECTLGKTFGCYENNHSMWVSNGCRGYFDCNGPVKCDHNEGGFQICDCNGEDPQVYARNLSDGSAAVAFYNPTDVAGNASISFDLLGWAKGTRGSVRDLWKHETLGTFTDGFPAGDGKVPVEPHATVVLRITPQHDTEIFT